MPRHAYQRFPQHGWIRGRPANQGGAQAAWPQEPQSRVRVRLRLVSEGKSVKTLKLFEPRFEWLKVAALEGAYQRPRPHQEGLIYNFRRVSHCYCHIVMGGNEDDGPVERFLLTRLKQRLARIRTVINNPKDALIALEQQAERFNWPKKVYERRRRSLKKRLLKDRKSLKLSSLRNLMSDLRFLLEERKLLEKEIRDIWKSGRRKSFARLPGLHERLHKNRSLFTRLHELGWMNWLQEQVTEIFYEIEADILRMARFGRRKDQRQRDGRIAVFATSRFVHRRQMMLIVHSEGWGSVNRVFAAATPNRHNRKQRRRIKPHKGQLYKRKPRSERRRLY